MGWFIDLLVDFGHYILYDHRAELLQILALILLYALRHKLKDFVDFVQDRLKQNAGNFALIITAILLLLTLDEPIIPIFFQFVGAVALIIFACRTKIKEKVLNEED